MISLIPEASSPCFRQLPKFPYWTPALSNRDFERERRLDPLLWLVNRLIAVLLTLW
jgi:hypothetical protein